MKNEFYGGKIKRIGIEKKIEIDKDIIVEEEKNYEMEN